MPIPTYDTLMLPLLKLTIDGNPQLIDDLSKQLSDQFNLTPEEREQRIPSGLQNNTNIGIEIT